MIRQCTTADLDFMLDVAAERYPPFDRAMAHAWGLKALSDPATLCARGQHGFTIVSVSAPFYAPTAWEARLLFLVAREGQAFEGVRLLRFVVNLTKAAGIQFRFGSLTDSDLAPLAKRLGAKVEPPSYVIEVDRG